MRAPAESDTVWLPWSGGSQAVASSCRPSSRSIDDSEARTRYPILCVRAQPGVDGMTLTRSAYQPLTAVFTRSYGTNIRRSPAIPPMLTSAIAPSLMLRVPPRHPPPPPRFPTSVRASQDYSLDIIRLSPGATLAQTRRTIAVEGVSRREGPSLAFVIIGGQKCGTTLLYECLNQHPLVVRGRKRETHFFDWNWQPRLKTVEQKRQFCESGGGGWGDNCGYTGVTLARVQRVCFGTVSAGFRVSVGCGEMRCDGVVGGRCDLARVAQAMLLRSASFPSKPFQESPTSYHSCLAFSNPSV